MAASKYSVLQIKPAKDSLTGQSAFIQFLASLKSSLKASFLDRLFGTYETITLEIINLNQTTFFVIACPEKMEHLVKSQLAAQYPTALITTMEDYLPSWLNHGHPLFGRLVLTGPSTLPINAAVDEKVDQMASIVGGLSRIPVNQSAVIQICLFAAPKGWQKSIRGVLDAGISKDPLKFTAHPQKALIEQKLAYQAYATDIRIAAITEDESSSKQLFSQIAASFGTYTSSEGNGFKPKVPKPNQQELLKHIMLERNAKYASQNQFLNYLELSSIYHLPSEVLASIKSISWGKSLKGEAPLNLHVDENIPESERHLYNFFAKTEYKNHMAVFGMKKGIDRLRHTYILGKSGTGKSTLIGRMAINDIQHGEGVAFVDPHGDTAEKLLEYIPESRIDDVAYLDPSIPGKSFWLNPLYVKNPALGEMVASSIVSIFSKLYGNSWGPRLEYILRNTLLTLVYKPETTLADVPRILTNKEFRETECLIHVKDPVLVNFWRDEYDKYSEKFQTEAIAPILNKVGQFVTSPTIRDIINHPKSTVDFEDMMNSGKIIILNLPQGKIGEDNAALLGAMFISQIQIAAMNRANILEEDRRDFFLYVDEFQNFATSSFVKILSEARKYRLGLILANQYIAQLPEDIQNAIFGNVGTVMSYVVGASDADRVMKELNNLYTADDLVGLAKYQLAMKLSINSQVSMPFSSYALPLPDTFTHIKDRVLEATFSKYYRKIEPLDMSQVTSTMTPAAKRYTEPPYIPKALRDQSPTDSVIRSEPPRIVQDTQNSSQPPFVSRSTSYTPPAAKAPYQPQLSPVPKPLANPPAVSDKVFKEPTLEELDNLRKQGLRPSVVGCFINNKKILLVYQKIHNLWQLPQGGVENKTTINQGFVKEMSEEVTEDFLKNTDPKTELIGEDKIEFPPSKQNLRDLKSDSGESLEMKGKYYYFMLSKANSSDITIGATEFDDYKWLNYDDAIKLIKDTNTGGKLRITSQILNYLKEKGLIEYTNYQEPNKQYGSQSTPERPVQSTNYQSRSTGSQSNRPANNFNRDRYDSRSGGRPYGQQYSGRSNQSRNNYSGDRNSSNRTATTTIRPESSGINTTNQNSSPSNSTSTGNSSSNEDNGRTIFDGNSKNNNT